jgi:hypothetical protein
MIGRGLLAQSFNDPGTGEPGAVRRTLVWGSPPIRITPLTEKSHSFTRSGDTHRLDGTSKHLLHLFT